MKNETPDEPEELGLIGLLLYGCILGVLESLVMAIPVYLVYADVMSLDDGKTIGYALVGLLASAVVRRIFRTVGGNDEEDLEWPLTLCIYLTSGGVLWLYFQTISAVAG